MNENASRPRITRDRAAGARIAAVLLLASALGCGTSSTGGGPSDGGGSGADAGVTPRDAGGTSDAGASDGGASDGGASGQALCSDAAPAPSCADGGVQVSSYDQTCQSDSDCVLVVEGSYACSACAICAPQAAINRTSLSQYESDVSRLSGATTGGGGCAPCCTPAPVACCQAGQCRAAPSCASDAGAE